MIDQLVYKYHLRSVFAEIDDDAVDFIENSDLKLRRSPKILTENPLPDTGVN